MKTFSRPAARNDQEPKSRRQGDLLLTLTLSSDAKLLSVVRGAVERVAETLGFPAKQRRSITRAADEALTNIIRHSYGNRLDKPIALYFRRVQRRLHGEVEYGLEILLCDRGPAIDLTKLQGRSLEEIRPGGLGLHLIRHAMDTVEFTRKGPTNRLRLVKYLAADEQRSVRIKTL